ncbi:cupin domain-containing protein [Endozoicomonas elysicola]|uniref:Phosphoribosylaminoimidazole carboxylase n=1 Tax=Endozoicomonas elysicola TaxID=305900 RepID=A0A081KBM6_9GAMM|nr:cupin domain-containing protein [Endozoicomonas elysicola]KEI71552.1 phosphoribosylaminoimidazole carboxylase [Endozoicomonas elysicola]
MKNNLFENIPSNLPEELFEILQGSGGVKIERIVSRGHATPEGEWYDQSWDEWVVLLKGLAILDFDGDKESVSLKSGDFIFLPAGLRHRVAWTEPDVDSIWLAIHFNF